MQTAPFPLSPFESPLHALVFIGVGVLFWGVGKSNLLLASNPDLARWGARNHPLFLMFANRPATVAEQRIWMPDSRFKFQRVCAQIQKWIGSALGSFGFACLIISILKNFT